MQGLSGFMVVPSSGVESGLGGLVKGMSLVSSDSSSGDMVVGGSTGCGAGCGGIVVGGHVVGVS